VAGTFAEFEGVEKLRASGGKDIEILKAYKNCEIDKAGVEALEVFTLDLDDAVYEFGQEFSFGNFVAYDSNGEFCEHDIYNKGIKLLINFLRSCKNLRELRVVDGESGTRTIAKKEKNGIAANIFDDDNNDLEKECLAKILCVTTKSLMGLQQLEKIVVDSENLKVISAFFNFLPENINSLVFSKKGFLEVSISSLSEILGCPVKETDGQVYFESLKTKKSVMIVNLVTWTLPQQ
jgi:hypothetical protein